jgi:hypothetical protein
MSNQHQPERDMLGEVVAAFQRMSVPDRPPDAEILARLGNSDGDKCRPVSPSPSKWRPVWAVVLSSAAALLFLCGAGLLVLVLNSAASLAVADVVKTAEKHKFVRYKQQTTDTGARAGARVDSTVYADLTAGRLRIESHVMGTDGETFVVSVFDSVRNLQMDSRHKTACLRRTPKDYKTFCCSLLEFEHHKGVTRSKDTLGNLAVVKYRFEDDNETSSLWVDATTKLPVRMEQELVRAAPDGTRTRFVWTDFEWGPDLPKSFRSLDELFSTQPPDGFTLEDRARE